MLNKASYNVNIAEKPSGKSWMGWSRLNAWVQEGYQFTYAGCFEREGEGGCCTGGGNLLVDRCKSVEM